MIDIDPLPIENVAVVPMNSGLGRTRGSDGCRKMETS